MSATVGQSSANPQAALNSDMGARPRDQWGHMIFHPFTRLGDEQIEASDALLIAELADSDYHLPGTSGGVPRLSPDPSRRIEKLAISSPNADYLPHLNLGNQVIAMCTDGRWGAEDWGQWPQWYFAGQDHYAYLLRKPDANTLKNHRLNRCWWNISETDFQCDPGLEFGLLSPCIAAEFHTIQQILMNEVNSCACSNGADYQKLTECAAKMRHCISALRFTPLPYNSVVFLVASAQRHCLETRAMLDKIAMAKNPPFQTNGYPPADNTRLGCVTDRITLVSEMYERGIPVWYIRPSSQVPLTTNIMRQAPVVLPARVGIQMKRWPNAPVFYQGPISRDMHVGIENWKPGNLQLHLLGRGSATHPSTSTSTNDHNWTMGQPVLDRKVKRPEPYSKAKAAAIVEKKKPQYIAINLDLFKVTDLPTDQTPPLDSWKAALADVQPHQHRIIQHPDFSLFRGYAFPPSHLFCSEDNKRNEEYMLSWLVMRSAWMGTLGESSNTPLPNPQNWRSYLRSVALDLELLRQDQRMPLPLPPPSSISRVTSRSSRRKAKETDTVKAIFNIYVPSQKALHMISWNGHIVWSRNKLDLQQIDRQFIVWDAEEHNFRVELTTLDHLIMAIMWSEPEGRTIRDRKLNALWPQGVTLSLELPTGSSCGLATNDWVKRCPYVEAFRDIISDWPGHIPAMLKRLSIHRAEAQVGVETVWDERAMEKVERIAAAHYCQTFFDYFGRAPAVPRRLPSL